MPNIALQCGIIYGPILSRRLGRSLGINLMPRDCKVCSFDCIYCQYGSTDNQTMDISGDFLPSVQEVATVLKHALRKPRTIDTITFSGNGEPTLHPDFHEIVKTVKTIRSDLRPSTRLAIFTNSSTIHQEKTKNALRMVDASIMKLDAGDPQTFLDINRPISEINFSKITTALKSCSNLMIQTMFVDGDISNARGAALKAWIDLIGEMRPSLVQIYSIERPPAKEYVKCVEPIKLEKIAKDLQKQLGINVEPFFRY